jgi:hypothetical protein
VVVRCQYNKAISRNPAERNNLDLQFVTTKQKAVNVG